MDTPQRSARVLHWIPGVDLRAKHDGLAALAKEELKVDVGTLRPGEFVMFINVSWTQVALYGANNWLAYHRSRDGGRLNPKALMQLPRFIRGNDVGYSQALDKVIRDEFATQHPRLGQDYLDVEHSEA